MSEGIQRLHSHSGLERELKFPKHLVLVDKEFETLFLADTVTPFKYAGVEYIKVPILSFIDKNGLFKNLMA